MNSLEIYRQMTEEEKQRTGGFAPDRVRILFAAIADELVVFGTSPLLNAAAGSAFVFFLQESRMNIKKSINRPVISLDSGQPRISPHKAVWMILFLAEHIRGNRAAAEELRNYINATMRPSEEFAASLEEAISDINEYVISTRKELMQTKSDPDREQTAGLLNEVGALLMQANEKLRALEKFHNTASVEKAYRILSDLYNIIADSRDSALRIAKAKQIRELEDASHNMTVFLEMISEYLAEYGIKTIMSRPGESFSPRIHTAADPEAASDAGRPVVRRSIRCGFAWNERVLQKELVETAELTDITETER